MPNESDPDYEPWKGQIKKELAALEGKVMLIGHSLGSSFLLKYLIVPFAHLAMYAEKLPQATIREVDGGGHQFNNDLSEVALDIANLQKEEI
jgi:hypothetical protein